MEERIAVGDSILLVVNGTVGAIAHFKVLWSGTILDQSRLVAGEGQFVHLSIAGVADTEEIKGNLTEVLKNSVKNTIYLLTKLVKLSYLEYSTHIRNKISPTMPWASHH